MISGGSKGLGLHLVESLLPVARVSTFARRKTPNVEQLLKSHPDKFRFAEVDISNEAQVKAFFTSSELQFGPIHRLVNNAAIGQDHLLAHISVADISSIIHVNLTSTIILSRLAVRSFLLNSTAGGIVNISSICGARGYTGLSVYSATKGALDAFTRSLARELGDKGILINSVAPGFFESEMSSVLAPRQIEVIKRRSATGKLSEPDEILPLVKMLLFENMNMTGQTIYVDGGSGI